MAARGIPLTFEFARFAKFIMTDALKDTPMKVNSAHPGSVVTEANPAGELSVEEGAKTAVQLATLRPGGPTGGFFHLGQQLPW